MVRKTRSPSKKMDTKGKVKKNLKSKVRKYNQKGGADLIDISKLMDVNYIKRLDTDNIDILGSIGPSSSENRYSAEIMGIEGNDGDLYFPSLKNRSNTINAGELLEVDELIKISNETEKVRGNVASYLKELQGAKFPQSGEYSSTPITNIGFKAEGLAEEPSLLKKGVQNIIDLNKARGEYNIDCVAEVLKKHPEEMWGSLESALGWKYTNLQAYSSFSPRQLGFLFAYSLDYSSGSASQFTRDNLDFLRQNFALFKLSDSDVNRLYNGVRLEGNDGLNNFVKNDELVKNIGIDILKDDAKGKLDNGGDGLYNLVYRLNVDRNLDEKEGSRLLKFLQALFLYNVYKFLVPLGDKIKEGVKKNDKLEYRGSILLKQLDGYVKLYSWVLASLFDLDESKTNILKKIDDLTPAQWKNVMDKVTNEFPIKVNTSKKMVVDETTSGFYKIFIKYQPKSLPYFGLSMNDEIARCSIKFIKNYYGEMKTLVEKISKKVIKVRDDLGKKVPRDEVVKMRDSIDAVLGKVALMPTEDQRNATLQTLINSLSLQFGLMRMEFHKLIRLNLLETAHFSKSGIKEYTKEQQEKEIKQNQVNLRSEALILLVVNMYKEYQKRYNKDGKTLFPDDFIPILLRSFGHQDTEAQAKMISLFKEKIENREDKEVITSSISKIFKPSDIIIKNSGDNERSGSFATLKEIKKQTAPNQSSTTSSTTSSTPSLQGHSALSKAVVSTSTGSTQSVGSSVLEGVAKTIIKPEFWQNCYNKLEKKLYLPIFYNNQVGILDIFKVAIDGKISSDPFPLSSSDYVYYFSVSTTERGLKRTEDLIRRKGILMITDTMGNIGNMKNWMALSTKFYRESILQNKKNSSLLRAHLFNILVNANTYRDEVSKSIGDMKISQVWAKYCAEYGAPLENCDILLAREAIVAFLGNIDKVDLKNNKLLLPYRMISTLS